MKAKDIIKQVPQEDIWAQEKWPDNNNNNNNNNNNKFKSMSYSSPVGEQVKVMVLRQGINFFDNTGCLKRGHIF